MDNIVRLFFISSAIVGVLIKIYYQKTFNSNNLEDKFFILLLYNAVLMSMHMLLNLCLYTINIHLNTYNINFIILVKNNFKLSKSAVIVNIELIIFIILIVINYKGIYNYIHNFDGLTCTTCMLISWILLKIMDSHDQDKGNICDINSMQGLDYGTSMAYNYYYGYLRLVLPSTGSFNKGLIEKLENIEDAHNINIAIHKLLILIPQSSYIPPDLKEASYQWMESAIELEDEVRDRAGIKKRSYHNIIYKIYSGGKQSSSTPLYVAVEGATPILTFFEVQKHAHPETNIYRKYQKAIVQKFYEKLKKLIENDPECADLCELIYYNDYNYNGIKVNVAKVILNRLFKDHKRN